MKVKIIIERGNDGTFGAYIDLKEERLSYSIIGDGATVKEAINDFHNSYNEVKAHYAEEGKKFTEAEFTFHYDIASFLNYYSSVLSLAGLSRLIGINQKQLSHYANGVKHPRPAMVRKIEGALHRFSAKLSQVHFNV